MIDVWGAVDHLTFVMFCKSCRWFLSTYCLWHSFSFYSDETIAYGKHLINFSRKSFGKKYHAYVYRVAINTGKYELKIL